MLSGAPPKVVSTLECSLVYIMLRNSEVEKTEQLCKSHIQWKVSM